MSQFLEIDPGCLKPNAWNPNVVPPDNAERLRNSIDKIGFFLPVICRELKKGELEILDGAHRVDGAKELGLPTVPVINLGKVDDIRAKSITLAANERYGSDDSAALAALYETIGEDQAKLFLPISDADLAAVMSVRNIDLDDLGLGDDDEEAPVPEKARPTQTHRVLRFKVQLEDAEKISTLIKDAQKRHGLKEADELTNAGDALVVLLLGKDDDDASA